MTGGGTDIIGQAIYSIAAYRSSGASQSVDRIQSHSTSLAVSASIRSTVNRLL